MGHLPRGGKQEKHTHHTHETWARSMSIAVQKGERGRGGGGEGEHTRMLGLFRRCWILQKQKRKGPPAREYPDPPFTLRKMPGSTGRTSFEPSQNLDGLRYSRQKCARMGARWEGVERQRCSVSTRKLFATGHPTRKPATPGGISRVKYIPPGGKPRKRGRDSFLSRPSFLGARILEGTRYYSCL